MSANIDTMMYVGETPWHGLGIQYDHPMHSSSEIVAAAHMDWTVDAAKMKTDLHGDIFNYNAIYRTDNNRVLGVVNKMYPNMVQNIDTFKAVEDLLGKSVEIETAASLGSGETIFGCFKISENYKILDDDIVHYFVIMNEHLKPDGKVTVLNTPIRVVCQNTLSAALNSNFYKLRIPIQTDLSVNSELARKLIGSAGDAIVELNDVAKKMYDVKVTQDDVSNILDELFPTPPEAKPDSKAADRVEIMRDTFIHNCMGADNLGNYRGTHYQMFQAVTDFSQHYFAKANNAYDLNYRMKLMPGMSSDGPASLVQKYLKIYKKAAA